MRTFLVLLLIVALAGCGNLMRASRDVKTTFTYDYEVPSVDRDELWVRARDYFAEAYVDSRSVLRVQDRDEATLIGRGGAFWKLAMNNCATAYKLRFQSKEGRARLQLELQEGVPAYSECGWPWPSTSGYNTIVKKFDNLAEGLGEALKKDETDFSDF